MTTYLALVVAGVVALTLARSVRAAFTSERSVVRDTWAAKRPWMVPAAFGLLLLVVLIASALYAIPWLRWGWWSAIGGVGNPGVGQTDTGATGWQGSLFTLVSIALPLMFAIAVINLAYVEEEIFRKGAEVDSRRQRFFDALRFGLAHCLIGVPLYIGLALTVAGLGFTAAYLRAYRANAPSLTASWLTEHKAAQDHATAASAALHATYNLMILTILGIGLAVSA